MAQTAALAEDRKAEDCWRGFKHGAWCDTIDVRDFIVHNATPYHGDQSFLAGPTERTRAVWAKLQPFFREEQERRARGRCQITVDPVGAQRRVY